MIRVGANRDLRGDATALDGYLNQFGEDWSNPDAPLLPSERRDRHAGACLRVGHDALRSGMAAAVQAWLPAWAGRLAPHGLRRFCASSLYARAWI